MTNRERLEKHLRDKYAFGLSGARRMVTYMLKREYRAELKAYEEGFHAGWETGQHDMQASEEEMARDAYQSGRKDEHDDLRDEGRLN